MLAFAMMGFALGFGQNHGNLGNFRIKVSDDINNVMPIKKYSITSDVAVDQRKD